MGEYRLRQLEILGELLFHSFSAGTAECGLDYTKSYLRKPHIELLNASDLSIM